MPLTSNTGIQPLITVVLPWGSYTHKDTLRSISNPARQSTSLGSVTTVQVVMDDTTGVFKTKLDTVAILGQPASVVLSYIDDTPSVTIIDGVITSDITWNEADRSFSFSIESKPSSGSIGYAAQVIGTGNTPNGYGWELGWTIPNWPYNLGGAYSAGKLNVQNATKAWPVVFGQALKVPALRVTDLDIGTLEDNIDESTTSFKVSGGQKFQQNTQMTICVGDVFYYGQFTNSKTFTVTRKNEAVQWHPTLFDNQFAARDSTDQSDYNDPSVAWIVDPINYRNKFVYVKCTAGANNGKYFANFVLTQKGRKLYFARPCPWKIDANYEIESYAGALKGTWVNEYGDTYNQFTFMNGADLGRYYPKDTWTIKKGTEVFHAGSQAQYYILDYHSGSDVKCLYAYRTYRGARLLTPIPSSYYQINVNSAPWVGKSVTAVIFPVMLSRYIDEGWEDDVYADISSTGSANLAEAIQEIIEDFTDLSVDAASFTDVTTKVANFPIGFAFTDQVDALKAAQEMAWQGRCELYRDGSIIYINYLSESKSSLITYNEDGVLMDSMEQSLTSIEDVTTLFKVKWKEDYSESGERQYTYTNNADIYGTMAKEFEFYIYNQQQLIQQSADFWGYRYSNVWRTIKFSLPMLDYDLYPSDKITMGLSDYVGSDSFVKTFNYNLANYTIDITAESACKMGAVITDSNYWLGNPDEPVNQNITVPDKLLDVEQKDYEILANVKDSEVNPYSIRVKNKTGATIEAYTVWKIMGKDATTGAAQLVKMEQTDDKDVGITPDRLVVMYSELANNEIGYGISCKRAEHIIKYDNDTFTDPPKKNQLMGPTKDSNGKLKRLSMANYAVAFTVIDVEDNLGTNKMVRVRGNEVLQKNLCLLQNNENSFVLDSDNLTQSKMADRPMMVYGLKGQTTSGTFIATLMLHNGTTFVAPSHQYLTVTNANPPPSITYGTDNNPSPIFIKKDQRWCFKITSVSSPKKGEVFALVMQRLEEESVP